MSRHGHVVVVRRRVREVAAHGEGHRPILWTDSRGRRTDRRDQPLRLVHIHSRRTQYHLTSLSCSALLSLLLACFPKTRVLKKVLLNIGICMHITYIYTPPSSTIHKKHQRCLQARFNLKSLGRSSQNIQNKSIQDIHT